MWLIGDSILAEAWDVLFVDSRTDLRWRYCSQTHMLTYCGKLLGFATILPELWQDMATSYFPCGYRLYRWRQCLRKCACKIQSPGNCPLVFWGRDDQHVLSF